MTGLWLKDCIAVGGSIAKVPVPERDVPVAGAKRGTVSKAESAPGTQGYRVGHIEVGYQTGSGGDLLYDRVRTPVKVGHDELHAVGAVGGTIQVGGVLKGAGVGLGQVERITKIPQPALDKLSASKAFIRKLHGGVAAACHITKPWRGEAVDIDFVVHGGRTSIGVQCTQVHNIHARVGKGVNDGVVVGGLYRAAIIKVPLVARHRVAWWCVAGIEGRGLAKAFFFGRKIYFQSAKQTDFHRVGAVTAIGIGHHQGDLVTGVELVVDVLRINLGAVIAFVQIPLPALNGAAICPGGAAIEKVNLARGFAYLNITFYQGNGYGAYLYPLTDGV